MLVINILIISHFYLNYFEQTARVTYPLSITGISSWNPTYIGKLRIFCAKLNLTAFTGFSVLNALRGFHDVEMTSHPPCQ